MYQKTIKGQALMDLFVAHLILDDLPLAIDLLDEEVITIALQKGWEMYSDGASRSTTGERKENPQEEVVGVGIVFVSLDIALIRYSFFHTKGCSNNTVQYEAVITGLELEL